jgi:hypothetical protein
VRGKVAAFVAGDATVTAEQRRRKRDEAHRCFALARAFAGAPVDPPFVVAVGGMVGSGKSTLAARLGRALAVPVVSSDHTRKSLAGRAPTQRGDAGLYQPASLERAYRELLRRAGVVVGSRRGVILDATFSTHRWRQAAAALAREAGARFVFIEASCPDRQLLRARLARRRHVPSVSDATDADLDRLARAYQPPDTDDPGPRLIVDTGTTPATAEHEALDKLRGQGVGGA